MSEVDTVWTWGGQTSTPQISKYLIKKSVWYGIRTQYNRAVIAWQVLLANTWTNLLFMIKKIKIFCKKKQKNSWFWKKSVYKILQKIA